MTDHAKESLTERSDMPADPFDGTTVPCPTCDRRGTVDRRFGSGVVMSYCGPNGERWPQETCRTCGGSGWISAGSRS